MATTKEDFLKLRDEHFLLVRTGVFLVLRVRQVSQRPTYVHSSDSRPGAVSLADTRSLATHAADTRSLATQSADSRSLATHQADSRTKYQQEN